RRRRRGVAGADEQDALAGVMALALAKYVVEPVARLIVRRDLADRRDPAVAEPAVIRVGAGAIEDDVRFLDALHVPLAQEQSKRALAALRVARRLRLQEPRSANLHDGCFGLDAVLQQIARGERRNVGVDVLDASDAITVAWKGRVAQGRATEWCAVHAEGAEEPDVPPAPHVLADMAALVDGDREAERARVKRRLQ